MYVENGGFTKIADTSTYDAFNTDNNGATVNYRIVPEGQPYTSDRFIDGRTPLQTPASIGDARPYLAHRHPSRFRDLPHPHAGDGRLPGHRAG